MVYGANSNAVHMAFGKTRSQPTSLSVYLFGPYREKDLLGLRAARCDRGETQLDNISDYI